MDIDNVIPPEQAARLASQAEGPLEAKALQDAGRLRERGVSEDQGREHGVVST